MDECGSDAPIEPPLELRAGSLQMIFEPQSAFLRYIKLGKREVVRGVYAAVRDRNWGTIAPQVSNLEKHINEQSFLLQFDVTHRKVTCHKVTHHTDDIDFVWRGELRGSEDGTITYYFRGTAKSTFWSNRIGLCVLHPMEGCAGQSCKIFHTNGTFESTTFPDYIAPHQPFLDVRAIMYEVTPGARVTTFFEGDTFETEDQRNWTDASFKTYSRPLALPFPFEIKSGTCIEQRVTISHGEVERSSHKSTFVAFGSSQTDKSTFTRQGEITISISNEPPVPLPLIGLSFVNHNIPLSEISIARLRKLSPTHLRVDVKLDEDYQTVWQCACDEAMQLQTSLEVALFVSDAAEDELQEFVKLIEDTPPIARWIIFHNNEKSTSRQWIELAREYLKRVSSAPIGSGTNAYFTEINRNRLPLDVVDFIAYSINPQVHAFDDRSLVETLPAQAQTVRSAQHFAPDKPIVVSPITLRPRYNADAREASSLSSDELPRNVDTRQLSLLGAAWTLVSVKHLAMSGAASLTYFETTGWRGVLETEEDSPLPQLFPSRPGAVFPLYHVLADIAEFAGGKVLLSHSSEPLKVECLALQLGDKSTFVLANFTSVSQSVRMENMSGRLRLLSKDNIEQALREPEKWRSEMAENFNEIIELPPYGLARIDKDEYS